MANSFVRAGAALLLLVGWTTLAPTPSTAQFEDPEWELGLGLGLRSQTVYLSNQGPIWTPAPLVYFHGVVDDRVMIEPSAGYTRIRATSTEPRYDRYGRTIRSMPALNSSLQFGLAVLLLSPSGEHGRSYWGPRLSFGRVVAARDDVPPGEWETHLDFTGAVVMGAEYFVASGLGLGGEAGLEYRRQGDPRLTHDDWTTTVELVVELRFRWYFQEEVDDDGG